MKQEFETQVLDIDVAETKKKLAKIGACGGERVLMKRYVFDLERVAGDCKRWVRVRESAGVTQITYKEKTGSGVTETSELEVNTADFEATAKIFQKLTCFIGEYYQENYRTQYIIPQGEVNIDEWPQVPAFLDIEAHTEKGVAEILALLGLAGKEAGHIGHVKIYKKYGLDLHSIKELKF